MKRKKTAIVVIALALLLEIIFALNSGDLSSINDVQTLGQTLGAITMLPTILAVTLAFITNNVIFSLLVGFLSGVILFAISSSSSYMNIPSAFINDLFKSISTVLFDTENLKIMLLCFAVGGMVEVVKSSGGFEALAIKLTNKVNTPRKAGLIGSLLGCLIFFDDYANALIVGPIMKPISDRVKMSREKLSYIVDSTAAPVAGMALVSSWVSVEVSSIEQGLQMVNINENGFTYFLESLPFCFYCIFALTFIFLNSLTCREYGPMLDAEINARKKTVSLNDEAEIKGIDKQSKRMMVAIISILLLVFVAIFGFYFEGRNILVQSGTIAKDAPITLDIIIKSISLSDTMLWIVISSFVGSVFAIITGCIYKLFSLKEALKSWFIGAKKIFSTIILLLLAWCLANTVTRIGATYYAVEIISTNVPWQIVPVLIFITCCVISFASGSYGCLFVVMPLAIPLAYRIISMGVTNDNNIYLLTCIGSVMAGSIFGDHCSPITDCTILSALGCGCDTMSHVHTQMPYAITVGVISILAIILSSFGLNVIIIWSLAILLELAILLLIGKKPI